jgi:predicted nucleic acid-binding protein
MEQARSGPASQRDDGMNVPAAVLDTNVWLDWLVFADPVIAPVRAAVASGQLRLLGLARGRDELADVLGREAVRLQAEAARRRRGLANLPAPLAALAEFDALVAMRPAPPACGLLCRDPDDQCFIDLAITEGARWLLTKDRALLALARQARRRSGLEIVPPGGFREGPGL